MTSRKMAAPAHHHARLALWRADAAGSGSPSTPPARRSAPGAGLGITVGHHSEQSARSSPAYRSYTLTPVSYTHLRAHETRHDLVCRLLLEKKKKKKKKN